MKQSDWRAVIDAAMKAAHDYLSSLPDRRVYSTAPPEEIRKLLAGPLPESPLPAEQVVAELASDLDPYISAHASGRYFGFVIGGLHPAAYGAELLAATWDQNAGLYPVTPGVAMVEEVARDWLLELLDLPRDGSIGFVTGGQMANFTCLAAARDAVLRDAGWNVEADGLQGAPKVRVIVKSEKHSTVARALRFLGLGHSSAVEVASDDQSRMVVEDLERALADLDGPTIVCVESGSVNTGSFDRFDAIADVVDEARSSGMPLWVHVDGAVGLWARASKRLAGSVKGLERMDSWSTDAHKLLNVGYDSGLAICKDTAAHRAAMGITASYLIQSDEGGPRDPMDWNPEFSRRARGLGVYATLRSLGRSGVEELVDRTCGLARRFAEALEASGKVDVINDVVFNQVVVHWKHDGDRDAFNDQVMARVREDGTAFFSGTTYNGQRMMRISVSDWATDEDDVDRAVAALLKAAGD